jgi:hypothetical protein
MAWYKPWRNDRNKRIGLGIATAGQSEVLNAGRDALKEPYQNITGITALNEAKHSANVLAEQQAAEEAQNLADQYSAIEKERKKRARMQGRQSTILAGGGELGGNSLNVMRKTLLGA